MTPRDRKSSRSFLVPLRILRAGGRRFAGQSLVEFTIMLPVLLIMLSGLVEYGILLNYYLDIIDAARDAARFASDADPLEPPLSIGDAFFTLIEDETKNSLKKSSDGRIDWVETGTYHPVCGAEINGDIVVSAFSVLSDVAQCAAKGESAPCIDQWFTGGAGDARHSMCGSYFAHSGLREADLNAMLSGGGIPNSGFVIVEVYYEYKQVLGLPWIQAFAADPIVLHAYSLMPNVHVEPTPTPSS